MLLILELRRSVLGTYSPLRGTASKWHESGCNRIAGGVEVGTIGAWIGILDTDEDVLLHKVLQVIRESDFDLHTCQSLGYFSSTSSHRRVLQKVVARPNQMFQIKIKNAILETLTTP